ncbi:flagellar filament capping protein FliD [Hominisplanchenecus murintestinalis]|uniref:flagellar filament capping protein FliD n=1 Tax=Hominisplanchenecus murintestinalis TaxID=2941517 RepID=UPI00203DDDAB|nr:flagellar filament capping protein FliD [Hominisplanchenecus murintestinalis]
MAKVNSLGNTSLRGFGGMASGIDRDAMIEAMTAGTTSKITTQRNKMQTLLWKQEAYQSVSGKIIDLDDKYFTYSSSKCLKSASLFARNQITAIGDEKYTRFVKASGTSSMIDNLSILGVKQLATTASRRSASNVGKLSTTLNSMDQEVNISNLKDTQLRFGVWTPLDGGKFNNTTTFTMPTSYKDESGTEHYIDYTTDDIEGLVDELNAALKNSDVMLGEDKIFDVMEFKYENGKINISTDGKKSTNYVMRSTSTALGALGYQVDAEADKEGISFNKFNDNVGNFADSYRKTYKADEYFTGKKVTFNYDGTSKDIELITQEEYDTLFKDSTLTGEERLAKMAENLQVRLDRAFGTGNVKAELTNVDGKDTLAFSTKNDASTVTITSFDANVKDALGIMYGASNKVNTYATLDKANLGISKDDMSNYTDANGNLDLVINGVKIEGLTAKSTVKDIISKINATPEAGVKASYVDSTGQLMLVSSETGAGRQIDVSGSELGKKLFMADPDNEDAGFVAGQDAEIAVSYGDGTVVNLTRSSNTFDLEGLKVSVTGKFGYDAAGNLDSSQAVTFNAQADVDGVTELVSKFFEEYNALVEEVNTQITSKPDKSYGPLTDEQKAEMTEAEIERWEKKAKQGLLFNDGTMRDLSGSLQSFLTDLMGTGISYDDLEEMGISVSSNYMDGGKIEFNETKFKQAMSTEPDKVAKVFTGEGTSSKGLAQSMQDRMTPYATRYGTRNGGSYGRLVEEAGSPKVPMSVMDNYIYREIESIQDMIATLQERLSSEEDRYIKQFTSMETMINKLNTQSGYLSQLQG